jgi:hypothetical protein
VSDFHPPPLPPPPPPGAGSSPPGTPSPPILPQRNRKPAIWIAAIVAVVLVAGGGILLARNRKEPSALPVGGTSSQSPGSVSGELSGTVTYRGPCVGTMYMHVTDLNSSLISRTKMTQVAAGPDCRGTFSTNLTQQAGIQLFLEVEQTDGSQATTLTGPSYTPSQLSNLGDKLTLTLNDFGLNASQQSVVADLSVAIKAAANFYKSHGTFVGLTTAYLEKQAPQLTFNTSSRAVKGEVTLRETTPATVLFIAVREDGTPIATGYKPPRLECYGEIDAKTFGQCVAWQPPGGTAPKPGSGSTPGQAPVSL